ncbi:MAG: glycosyltransferase family 2 protein [Nitrospinae bacterium]|nr:glycosyltransferase family 2 protein [Nitrospinota bacterium]
MSPPVPSFTFIVPALNEEKNVVAAVETITVAAQTAGLADYEIIIVDDGSSDDTAKVAEPIGERRAEITLLRNKTRQGVGKSFLAGVAIARKEYCLIFPGDNEFSLDFLPDAVVALTSGAAEFVITYVSNPWTRPWRRRILSGIYLRLFNLIFGTNFRYTNGIVVYPTGWIRSAPLVSGGYTFQSEALWRAHRMGKRFFDVGMTIRPRAHGKSKAVSLRVVAETLVALARMWRASRRSQRI